MLLDVPCVAASPLTPPAWRPARSAMPRKATESVATAHRKSEIVPLSQRWADCRLEASAVMPEVLHNAVNLG
jgi:hypothetical protein